MTTESATRRTRLAYRWDDLVELTGMSRRWLEKAVSAGEFPPPDRTVRRMHLWHHETVDRWLRGERGRGR